MSNNILCLDYGERHVGVAIADLEDRIALRHSTIDQKEGDVLNKVEEIVDREGVEKILVSVPQSLSGEETAQTRVSLDFIDRLKGKFGDGVEVEEVNEVFSSKEAQRRLRSEGGNKEEEHMEAARLLLADYIVKNLSDE